MTKCLTRDDIVQRLATKRADLDRLHVKSLRLFGSFARDAANENSDVDMIAEFDGQKTLSGYMAAKFFLEDLFERSVDLATEPALRPELRDKILSEAVRVA